MSNANKVDTNEMVVLDNKEMTAAQFNEKLDNLKSGERIIETSAGHYTTVSRMQG